MICTIFRKLFNIEELKRIETEERAQAIAEITVINIERVGLISRESGLTDIKSQHQTNLQEVIEWSLPSNFVWSPSLLTDFGIFKNIGTPYDIQSGF